MKSKNEAMQGSQQTTYHRGRRIDCNHDDRRVAVPIAVARLVLELITGDGLIGADRDLARRWENGVLTEIWPVLEMLLSSTSMRTELEFEDLQPPRELT